ncbi:MAG: GntR family transcriptional regulator [Desulfamplus sp.]|nr:GntR family transcriptional regulator [Desulfamplus sp.]MBF0412729.1 GntR family transcriptional regulator [Desulfamplus sp.]
MKDAKNLTLTAYNKIKQMMFDYDIVPGQRLVFVDLAKQLNVSRTPVNNALSILAKEGFLDFVPNQGYWVRKLTKQEAESLYEIREILETGIIGKAIRNLNDEKITKLEQCKNNYEQAVNDHVSRNLFVLDMEFHGCIVDFIENKFLSAQYREICHKIFLRFRTEKLLIQRINDIVKEHKELFETIKIKDVGRTLELIKNHNQNARLHLFKIIFDD